MLYFYERCAAGIITPVIPEVVGVAAVEQQPPKGDGNIAKTLHFVLDALFAGFPEVYRAIRDQLREHHEGWIYEGHH